MAFTRDVAIVGGCGRVGLPLGIALADAGLTVSAYDIDAAAVALVGRAEMPFMEEGAAEPLRRVVSSGSLVATTEAAAVADAEHVVVIVGTPIDSHLNPDPESVPNVVSDLREHLRDGQHLVLRSTVYPGVTAMVERVIGRLGLEIDVSFCPERIAEGRAMTELRELPQLISARSEATLARADKLFAHVASTRVVLDVEEAELAKLFTNTWRYIRFAAANQLYMIANEHGLDFDRIRAALVQDYPRAHDMPGPGFTAGPCLLKDTMQLAAFNNNNFTLGHASMMVNEGLPLYLVDRLEQQHDLSALRIGLLGMAFKEESDDTRSSLSYKLRRLLRSKAAEVRCTDPYVRTDDSLLPLDEVVSSSDLLIIGAPHQQYADLDVDVPVVDVWNLRGEGVRI